MSPARLGLVTSLGAGFAVLLLSGVFQLIVPPRSGITGTYLGAANGNMRAVILYAAAGGCHALLCAFGTLFLAARLKAEESGSELKKIAAYLTVSFAVILGAVFLACYFNLAVVERSYFETVRPMVGDERFGRLLMAVRIPVLDARLQPFALVPLSFVIFGIAFSIMACFWAAHRAVDFVRRADDIREAEVVELKREIAQLMSLLSAVFTSSCIATITFLQLGRDWIEKGSSKDAYVQNGYAMSIFWSACFTLIMLAIVLIPLFWVGRQTLRIRRQAKYAGKRAGFYDPLFDVFSYGFLSKGAAATLMPVVTSSIAAAIGS